MVDTRPDVGDLPIGYFGASTGAAAALRTARRPDTDVGAVVSRGGRIDLAGESANALDTPCLFIVGGDDTEVLERNEATFEKLDCTKSLEVVEGAGELATVADLADDWFRRHLD